MAEINLGNDETINATLSNVDTIQANVSTEESISANVYDVNYIPGYVVAEQERRANEIIRQSNEADRIALYNDMEYKLETDYFKGEKGDKGDPGDDATVNGTPTLTITTSSPLTGTQSEDTFTIGADLSAYATKTDLNDYATKTDLSAKQNITDNTLTTINKTIPTAINEVNSIAKGANQALSYASYSAMVTAVNALSSTALNVGQNIMIVTVEVPDLWVSGVESTSSTYTYVDDATIINELKTNGYIQVGYYKLSMLETQKVDLTGYQTLIDSSHKLLADLVDDTNQTNKFVTANEKTTWNSAVQPNDLGAVAFSNSYSDLDDKPSALWVRTSLGSSTNLNNLLTGIYEIKNVTHNDFPITGSCFGVLVQYSGEYKPQMFVAGGAGECSMYYRRWLTASNSFTPWTMANDVAWVEYGTTTYAEVTDLISKNKEILCSYNDRTYRYTYDNGTNYYFTCLSSSAASWQIRVSNANNWSSTSATLQKASNMIKSTDATSPTDDNYYSALTVYNMVGDIESLLYTLNSGGGAS